jgi:hypothetical protein
MNISKEHKSILFAIFLLSFNLLFRYSEFLFHINTNRGILGLILKILYFIFFIISIFFTFEVTSSYLRKKNTNKKLYYFIPLFIYQLITILGLIWIIISRTV